MRFHASVALEYAIRFPTTLLLNVQVQRNEMQTILEEHLRVDPPLSVSEFTPDGSHNRFLRIHTALHPSLTVHYSASVECCEEVYVPRAGEDTPVAGLNASAIPYLFPSRYCQSDRLSRLAWDLFGGIDSPHDRVAAVADWIHDNVEYLRGSTDSMTSAYDTVTQRTGVCRDFAHLGIALCRALNIPSRYVTAYAYELDPPDFHACFECFIGGAWVVYDATRLAHLNGLVRIGTGRDAADAAVASIFGNAVCTRSDVTCVLDPTESFVPIDQRHATEGSALIVPSA